MRISILPTGCLLALRLGLLAVLLGFVWGAPAGAQNVVHHVDPSFDDGVPERDADGVKNGVVVWAAGKVHVLTSYGVGSWFVGNNMVRGILVIQPGAIVKVAGEVTVENGRVTRWTPALSASLGGTMRINGATITDIRDDTVGGDTNGDGNATQPPANAAVNYVIAFSAEAGNELRGSTIKYCTRMGRIPSMPITDNQFLFFGGLDHSSDFPQSTGPVILNARPVITGNTFEFASGYSGRGLDLRGMVPLVENNTFRGASTAVLLGPRHEYGSYDFERRGPTTGTAIVANNVIEAETGISLTAARHDSLFAYTQFRAEVRGNRVTGRCISCTPNTLPGGTALIVSNEADVVVTGNTFDNFRNALGVSVSSRDVALPRINDNRFNGPFSQTESVRTLPQRLWSKGILLNVENNFWGDPSGPRDPSASDGISNPRGRGYAYGDGFDYVPFIGGVPPPPLDVVSATVTSSPSAPLVIGATVGFSATATYVLRSAASGQLILLVRDADGNILNPNAPATTVSAGGTGGGTVALPAVQVEIPDDTPYVTAEVTLAPAGDGEPVRSSPVTFAVNRPRSGITWITPIGPYPVPTVGTRLRVTLKIDYALATSSPTRNGLLEITITERIAGTKTVLQMFPVVSIDAPPGESKSVTHTFEVDVPLRDVLTEPQNRVLYGELVLKDDAGVVKDKQGTGLPIQNPNLADLVSATPSRIETGGDAPVVTPLGRAHLFVGETPALRFGVRIRRATEGGGTWQLLIGPARFLDGTGRLLLNLPESQPAASDVPVLPNPVSLTQARTFEGRLPGGIPAGTRRLRMYLRLVNGSGVVAAADSIDVEVRDAPTVTAQRDVATGASNLAFTPVRATVNVTANTRAGRLTAEEIAGTFTATGRAHGPVYEEAGQTLSQGSVLADVAYRLIPINRYWALYGTLQESGLNATVTFTYDRTTDFPSDAAFREDSLVIAGLNPLSRALDPLPTTLNKTAQTVRAAYTTFYDTYVVASRKTVNSPTASEEDALPEGFGLDGVFPNPSRGPATVRFRLPESSSVRVEVFDVLGRRVSVLVEGSRAAGVHEAVWDGSSVGPGVYVVRLTAGGALATALLVRR